MKVPKELQTAIHLTEKAQTSERANNARQKAEDRLIKSALAKIRQGPYGTSIQNAVRDLKQAGAVIEKGHALLSKYGLRFSKNYHKGNVMELSIGHFEVFQKMHGDLKLPKREDPINAAYVISMLVRAQTQVEFDAILRANGINWK